MKRLQGRRAIVTGSSAGIGRAIARRLAAEGAQVVINARGTGTNGVAALQSVVDEIKAAGGEAIAVAGAVNDPDFAVKLVETSVDAFGGVDILINNAAIFSGESIGPVLGCSLAEWRNTMSVNLDAVFYTSRAALPHMMAQRWGRIINAASFAGTGKMGGSAYSASKAALFGLTRAMAADYGPYNITANVYNPEARTAMGEMVDPAAFEAMLQHWLDRGFRSEAELKFIRNLCLPDGVAPFIAYLCEDGTAHINGQVFAVEARRIARLAEPEEQEALFHDYIAQGPWPQDKLADMAGIAFPLQNRWPARSDAELKTWEVS